jgi:hypothetical protein
MRTIYPLPVMLLDFIIGNYTDVPVKAVCVALIVTVKFKFAIISFYLLSITRLAGQ